MSLPAIGVVIPCYKAEHTLRQTVESVLQGAPDNLQLVLVEDGSPDGTGAYTWWSYMFNARANNAGWRIDYFLVSDRIADKITATPIYSDIQGSDHCPVGLEIEL